MKIHLPHGIFGQPIKQIVLSKVLVIMSMKVVQRLLREVDQKCLKPGDSMTEETITKPLIIMKPLLSQERLTISQYMHSLTLMTQSETVEKRILKLNSLILAGQNSLELPLIRSIPTQIQPGAI